MKKVVEEIEQIEGGPFHRRLLLFWDDNLVGNPVWARKLFEEMAPLKKKWVAQLTFTITEDKELVRAAAKSGCVGLFFGLESFNSLSLKNSNKKHNMVEKYKDGIKLLHDHGISVYAGTRICPYTKSWPKKIESSTMIGLNTMATMRFFIPGT